MGRKEDKMTDWLQGRTHTLILLWFFSLRFVTGILSFINSSSQETAALKLSPMHTSPLRISRKGKTLHYGSHGRFSCHRAVVSAEYRFAYNCLSIYLSSLLDLFLGSIPHMYTSLCLQVLQDTSGCYLKVGYKMYTWNLSGNVFIFDECPAQLQWCILLATKFSRRIPGFEDFQFQR
jgi:hypothetical protein